ncbi:MAG: 1-acyl-sn-glycerol-3-phosphate acyltransferase [Bdellovibrionaceae bacterium]|nr:1-acyl-sn-glycerol-3-phosphate acyltransferase [Pseudobdellovibrionaceae bacterium]MDW8189909.1 lysophospholipid acyltransferase family protein [Pseudobdellovibrionaceae bacterium]
MKEFDYENEQWTKLPPELKHLPLFTRHIDLFSFLVKQLWALVLKGWFFNTYIRIKLHGNFEEIYKHHKKLIIISNHTSHLDAVSIAAAIPLKYWNFLYIAAAKDYFFSNPLFTFFSQHCLGAIPIDRKHHKGEAIKLCVNLMNVLENMWLIMFPEGTRSTDGKIHDFKKGISIISEKTQAPILFLYIKGGYQLWPKGRIFAIPGQLEMFIGPVQNPGARIDEIYQNYREWIKTLGYQESL